MIMKRTIATLSLFFCFVLTIDLCAAEPLRIFLRGGAKTHGPSGNGLHEHERWLNDWKTLLAERGAKVQGAMEFPTESQLAETDVLVMFAANAGNISQGQRRYLEQYLARGGGIVCFHDAVCGDDPQWFKTIIGGAWEHGHSKWFEGEVSFYYVDNDHPITSGASNFDIEDEVYWDLHMMPSARVLAASWQPDRRNTRSGRQFPHIYDVIPQMWVYEKDKYRSFVSLLGHQYETFQKPHVRAVLLRGIAWAGQREVESLCKPEELATLRYPEGGPTAPEKAAELLELHPDFEMSLVAAEPLVNKPMNLDWDPSGRLWVAETPEYPNGRRGLRRDMAGEAWIDQGGLVDEPGQQDRPARDRISILTDTDGDGRMDMKEIFFEGLELVTSFVFHKDGVIASAAPDIFWLRDTDGNGKAETVEILYTGLGTRDTHAVINNLRWGFDGWIYATHGYSAGRVMSADGSKDFGNIGSGVVRFKPDGSAFEQYSSKGGNTWGLDVTWDNEIFFTQPTSGDLLNHVVLPEATLARGRVGNTPSYKTQIRGRQSFPVIETENLAYVQIDQVGYFTASAGCAIYDGGTWPEEWNYSYFTTEPTIRLLHHEVVTPDGVSYAAHKTRQQEFLGGKDWWYCPIETRIGPDGALYVLDFYNQAVIHNDTRGPRHNEVNAAVRPDRDHYFGRVWKIDHKEAREQAVPNLAQASTRELIGALQHPNSHVRMNAFRLLVEQGNDNAARGLERLARNSEHAHARIAALWALQQLGQMTEPVLLAALESPEASVRKNALRIAQVAAPDATATANAVRRALDDDDAQVRLEAILALGETGVNDESAAALVSAYPNLDDPWMRSAVVGLMAESPVPFLNAAMAAANPDQVTGLVEELTRQIADKQDAALAARLVTSVAAQPASAGALQQVALETLARNLRPDVVPGWSDDLRMAFQKLLQSGDSGVPAAALPLISRWDRDQTLSRELANLVQSLLGRLNAPGQDPDQRAALAASLLGVRQMDDRILPSVTALLAGDYPGSLKNRIIETLGATADPMVGPQVAGVYVQLSPELQETAIGEMLKRTDWTRSFLAAIKDGTVPHASLRPSTVDRLRYHSDRGVAAAANELFDELRGPELKQKNELIAQFTPLVQKHGDMARGKELFVQNCAICHQYEDMGRQVGPSLNGMGAHGPTELLVQILDPNRAVEDTYLSTSIETKDDEIYDGIVVRENRRSLILRNASGEMEIDKDNVASRRSTGRSLMPEGFEALGGESLRDLLTYMTAADSIYRFLDLTGAYTADTRRGIYADASREWDSLKFRQYGPVSVEGVPFNIMDPARAPGGRNVIVLKGGGGNNFAATLPQKVEIEVGHPVAKLHFLGGVGGWAWPFGGESAKGRPVMKATVHFEDGRTEALVMKDGVEFADYIREVDVPGSKLAEGVVRGNQVRYFVKSLQQPGVVKTIELESYDGMVAPTTVAITAELPHGESAVASASNETVAATPANEAPARASALKVVIAGGGSAHDYDRWFNKYDTELLAEGGFAQATYSDKPAELPELLKDADVLCQTANHEMAPEARKAIFDFAESGKGLVIVHAGMWYNWRDWTEYNRVLCGGGSRGHDRYGTFDVKITGEHPILEGVPKEFTIDDELYYFEPSEDGTPVEVLATAHSKQRDKTYPMVMIVKHPKARIVNITLGHDGAAHRHPAFQKLLRNAVAWVAEER